MSLKNFKTFTFFVVFGVMYVLLPHYSFAAKCDAYTAEPVGTCEVCDQPGYRCARKGSVYSCVLDESCGEETTCTPKGGYCGLSRDCCVGYICESSICKSCHVAGTSCSSNSECCDPAICSNGTCKIDLFGTECSTYGEPCDSETPCCSTLTCNINTCGPALDDTYKGPRITSWQNLITPVAKALYYGALFLGFCYIVISGYMLMTSEGDPKRTQDAQGQLTAAIIGIIFILLSAAILRVIINSLIGGNISI